MLYYYVILLKVQFVKKTSLETAIGQQIKEERYDHK